jgi:hypothetical protein
MAAKFVALTSCSKEVGWLRNLLMKIPVWPKPMSPVSLHCDNQATLLPIIVISIMGNDKSRHISLRHKYVKQLLTDRVITIDFVMSVQNLVDPLNYLVH